MFCYVAVQAYILIDRIKALMEGYCKTDNSIFNSTSNSIFSVSQAQDHSPSPSACTRQNQAQACLTIILELKYINFYHVYQKIQHEQKLPETNFQYLGLKYIFFSFQVQLNADMNIELYAIYAVLKHV